MSGNRNVCVVPGLIGGVVKYGTPSSAFGTSKPCQWIDVVSRLSAFERVVNPQHGDVALSESQHRRRDAAVDGERLDTLASGRDRGLGDRQIVFDFLGVES
jgi:hypothetical protein